jgi:hypothetical protein
MSNIEVRTNALYSIRHSKLDIQHSLFFDFFKINVIAGFWLAGGVIIGRRLLVIGSILLKRVLLRLVLALKFLYLATNAPRHFNDGHEEVNYKLVNKNGKEYI